jgi:hypothetical protein
MQKWKKWSEEEIVDVVQYINDWLKDNPFGKIAIGTDSIEHKRNTIYATAIAMFYGTKEKSGIRYDKGAHIIFTKEKFAKKYDLWSKLWKEIENSREIGEMIREKTNCKDVEIHIDISPDEEWKSNKLLQAAMGYLKSYDFTVFAKPDSWVASCAADNLIR